MLREKEGKNVTSLMVGICSSDTESREVKKEDKEKVEGEVEEDGGRTHLGVRQYTCHRVHL